MQRRSFLAASLAAPAIGGLGLSSGLARAQAVAVAPKARVIVIGGGMAGTAVAKYLRLWGDAVEVTLIERYPKYVSNIMSSLVLTGQRKLSGLTYGYDLLKSKYGVKVVIDKVVEVDPVAVRVRLKSGRTLTADRIVMAPGIAFDSYAGSHDAKLTPHAWQAGSQTTLLQQQLSAMPAGGTVVLTIPKAPYRCPPGPYERACLLADWLKSNKPRSKLLVLDANPDYVTEKDNFSAAFTGLHASVIEYATDVEIDTVDSSKLMLYTNMGAIGGDVINLIPPQRAPKLVAATGLLVPASGSLFAPVNVLSYASKVAPKVHLIGDSSATTQPKAGHIANQEAKVCADALSRIFAGGAPDPSPVTNSACYSTITRNKASWLTAVFRYDAATKAMAAVADGSGASDGWSGDNFEQMNTWFNALMGDTFA